jgi:hypothetical protein
VAAEAGAVDTLLSLYFTATSPEDPVRDLALALIEKIGSRRVTASELTHLLRLCVNDDPEIVAQRLAMLLRMAKVSSELREAAFIELDLSRKGHAAVVVRFP